MTFVYQGSVSVAGTFKGKEAVARWHQRMFEQFPQRNVTVTKVYVSNPFGLRSNDYAVEWDWFGINKDGKQIQNRCVTLTKVKKGKATFVQQYVFDPQVQREAWGE